MKNTTQWPDESAASGDRILLHFIIPLVRLFSHHALCAVAFFIKQIFMLFSSSVSSPDAFSVSPAYLPQ
jgi:hypothetical protein